jgi:hypothetical protein
VSKLWGTERCCTLGDSSHKYVTILRMFDFKMAVLRYVIRHL